MLQYVQQITTCYNQKEYIMETKQYVCPKCGCESYESDQFQATGGNLARVFDVQNKRFITISCAN